LKSNPETKSKTKVFILIHGAQNVLPVICALRTLVLQNAQITIIMRQHSLSDNRFRTQEAVVRNFFKSLEVNYLIFNESKWRQFKKGLIRLDENDKSVDVKTSFLYPHDLTSDTSQVIAKTINSDENICYGDGYGLLINNISKIYFSLNPTGQVKFWKHLFRWLRYRVPQSVSPDKFVAILPVSQIQNIPLGSVTLMIPDKKIVLQEILDFHISNSELENKFRDQINVSKNGFSTVVLLLENFSECGFIDMKNELNLYLDVVNENVKKGSWINIKPHPWSNGSLAESLSRELAVDYNVRVIRGEVENYPIELWPVDFSKIDLISMSTPALSFKYLFKKEVIQPLTMDKVVKYFEPEHYQALRMQIELTDKPIENLRNWDMKSFLHVSNDR
jgi:hypothetical protein